MHCTRCNSTLLNRSGTTRTKGEQMWRCKACGLTSIRVRNSDSVPEVDNIIAVGKLLDKCSQQHNRCKGCSVDKACRKWFSDIGENDSIEDLKKQHQELVLERR